MARALLHRGADQPPATQQAIWQQLCERGIHCGHQWSSIGDTGQTWAFFGERLQQPWAAPGLGSYATRVLMVLGGALGVTPSSPAGSHLGHSCCAQPLASSTASPIGIQSRVLPNLVVFWHFGLPNRFVFWALWARADQLTLNFGLGTYSLELLPLRSPFLQTFPMTFPGFPPAEPSSVPSGVASLTPTSNC